MRHKANVIRHPGRSAGRRPGRAKREPEPFSELRSNATFANDPGAFAFAKGRDDVQPARALCARPRPFEKRLDVLPGLDYIPINRTHRGALLEAFAKRGPVRRLRAGFANPHPGGVGAPPAATMSRCREPADTRGKSPAGKRGPTLHPERELRARAAVERRTARRLFAGDAPRGARTGDADRVHPFASGAERKWCAARRSAPLATCARGKRRGRPRALQTTGARARARRKQQGRRRAFAPT